MLFVQDQENPTVGECMVAIGFIAAQAMLAHERLLVLDRQGAAQSVDEIIEVTKQFHSNGGDFISRMRRAYEGTRSGLEESKVFLQFFKPAMTSAPLCCLQLGMAIMMDKPIVVLADQLENIPKNLRKIAIVTDVVDMKDTAAHVRVKDALDRADKLLEKNQ